LWLIILSDPMRDCGAEADLTDQPPGLSTNGSWMSPLLLKKTFGPGASLPHHRPPLPAASAGVY
jgi:hypothetical protein